MEWIAHKIDTFLAAIVIAVAAIAASQAHVFMTQYMGHLGGELATARAQLQSVQTGLRYKLMNESVRAEIEAEARGRAGLLQNAYDAVARTNVLVRPLAFAHSADRGMVRQTWKGFIPALPKTPEAIMYMLIGMIIGFAAYEIVKLPVGYILSDSRKRRFRRRG